jgi:urease accessory protein UreH
MIENKSAEAVAWEVLKCARRSCREAALKATQHVCLSLRAPGDEELRDAAEEVLEEYRQKIEELGEATAEFSRVGLAAQRRIEND